MKRKSFLILIGLTAALMLSACGSDSSDSTEADAPAGTETETEAEESGLEAITPSDYLVENASDYITVGNLDGLEVTQYTYEITDETIQEEIDSELEMYGEGTEVDRAAEYGDIVYLDLVCTVESSNESYEEPDTYFFLGDAEYGEAFDEALIGAAAGDELEFSISFSEEDGEELLIDEMWIGETVLFEATISSVCEYTVPEFNDDFVAEYTEYSTTEEYEEALREELEAEYEEYSYADLLEALIAAALDECEISEIPDDLYDACYEETIESYAFFLDTDDEEELLEELEMTQEEFDSEVGDLAGRRLLISYICEEDGIEVTEEDYVDYVEEYAEYYGYETAADFEADMLRSYLVWSLYESKATEVLYNNANITAVSYDELVLTDEDADELDEEDLDEEDLDEDIEEDIIEEDVIDEETEESAGDETE